MEGGSSGISTFIQSITTALADFNLTNLAAVLTAALGLTVTLILAWFAYRFIRRAIEKAYKGRRSQ